MFNFFKRKEQFFGERDRILITQEAKWKTLASICEKEKDVVLVFWFPGTLKTAQDDLISKPELTERFLLAGQVLQPQIEGKKIIMAEHYPLKQKEKDFFERMKLTGVEVWSALDEPLFKEFGSDKIIMMMKQLGMKEDEVIEHSMISSAISNTQEKIKGKVVIDQTAGSQEEWLRKNLKAS